MHYCFLSTGTWEANASFVRLRELGSEFLKLGHQVSYVVDDMPYNRSNLQLPATRIEYVPRGRWNELLFRRAAIACLDPDYVHVLNPYEKAFLALACTRRKIIGDWDEWPARRPYPFAKKCAARCLDRWLRNRSHRVIVASRYLQREFKRLFNIEAVYLPYAIYLKLRETGQSPFSEPTAIYMGNLYPAYDHDLIIDAAKILKSRGIEPAIKLLGGGPDLVKWRDVVRQNALTKVELPGYVAGEELWRYLTHAHVLLFPIRETLLNLCRCPSKTFAYAQAGRPVITNRVGEVPEVLGPAANYVECTPEAFADAIELAMKSPQPSVQYDLASSTWSARAEDLLAALERK